MISACDMVCTDVTSPLGQKGVDGTALGGGFLIMWGPCGTLSVRSTALSLGTEGHKQK